MSYRFATYEKRGRIAYVTVNRPEVMNALHLEAHLELAEIQAALKIENESRARGWGELFQTKGMRHRSLVAAALGLFVQFSGKFASLDPCIKTIRRLTVY